MKRLFTALLVLAEPTGIAQADIRARTVRRSTAMIRRWMMALATLVCLAVPAYAVKVDTIYLKGFARSGSVVTTITDSIPFGTTFTTRWLPIHGARMVSFQMQAALLDSDSVVTVRFNNIDTSSAGVAATIATATTTVGAIGQGAGVYSNYAGTGGVSWGPSTARTINIYPLLGVNAAAPYIPVRWVRFTVQAPTRGDAGALNMALATMHNVKILVQVYRDDSDKGADPYYPLSGAAQ